MQSHDVKEWRLFVALVSVFTMMAAGLVITGYFYYRTYGKHYRAEVERQLSAIPLCRCVGRGCRSVVRGYRSVCRDCRSVARAAEASVEVAEAWLELPKPR